MTVRAVEMFTVDCDGCGRNADEGSDYAAWGDRESAVAMAKDGAQFEEFDGRLYCPECVVYDEEADEYRPKARAS